MHNYLIIDDLRINIWDGKIIFAKLNSNSITSISEVQNLRTGSSTLNYVLTINISLIVGYKYYMDIFISSDNRMISLYKLIYLLTFLIKLRAFDL